jgi:hypothetical protein
MINKVEEKRTVSVTSSHALFSLLFKHDDSRCRPWFGSAWSSSEGFGLAQSVSLFQDNLKHLSAKFKGKILSCIQINTVFN